MDFKPLGDARERYWMTIKMADAVGLSLVDAWSAGRLSPQAFDGMITRCRGCSEPRACARLLEGRPALDKPPAYCANADFFDGLATTAD